MDGDDGFAWYRRTPLPEKAKRRPEEDVVGRMPEHGKEPQNTLWGSRVELLRKMTSRIAAQQGRLRRTAAPLIAMPLDDR